MTLASLCFLLQRFPLWMCVTQPWNRKRRNRVWCQKPSTPALGIYFWIPEREICCFMRSYVVGSFKSTSACRVVGMGATQCVCWRGVGLSSWNLFLFSHVTYISFKTQLNQRNKLLFLGHIILRYAEQNSTPINEGKIVPVLYSWWHNRSWCVFRRIEDDRVASISVQTSQHSDCTKIETYCKSGILK